MQTLSQHQEPVQSVHAASSILANLKPVTPGMMTLRLQHLAQDIDMSLQHLQVADSRWEREKYDALVHKAAEMRALAEMFRLAQ